MTIIRPSIYTQNARFIMLLLSFILISGVLYIFTYNALVNARYQISSLKDQITKVTNDNTDLKSQIFKVTDPKALDALATKYNLVLETKPEYLTEHQWVSDLSF
ncbi:hypothetical protein M1506_00120 [Patescibacteria group bacterium]|nr:hypothetical protein [Patescibacteria group bacterium]